MVETRGGRVGLSKRSEGRRRNRSHDLATTKDMNPGSMSRSPGRLLLKVVIGSAVVSAAIASAIATKQVAGRVTPLAAVQTVAVPDASRVRPQILAMPEPAPLVVEDEVESESVDPTPDVDSETLKYAADGQVRWFNGRPARPARQYWMTVTGYSPDEESCGDSADGLTATLHSVETNAGKLVAADTRLLAYGSLVTVPGYDDGNIVPVLDCGGAIKGRKLDLLFPTDGQARKWGKQRILVTVWEYADGKPAEDVRKLR